MTLDDIPFQTTEGASTSLAAYRGQVKLIVNVASRCGLSPQYEQLEQLQRTYGERGFTVLGFPSNQFLQEGSTLNREAVKQVVENNGFDSVLVTQYLGTQRELEYVPGTYEDYFGYMAPLVYEPGYVRETRTVKLETRLFDAKSGGKLLWSASTSTVDPTSAQKSIPTVAQKIVEKLQKDIRI